MKFLGLEVGNWADWVSGIITALGLCVSLYWNYNNSKTKLNVEMFDIAFNINNVKKTTGTLLFRIYNSGNKSVLIDEIGIRVHYINNVKVRNIYIPINDEKDFENRDILYLCNIKPNSDYSRRFLLSDVIAFFNFFAYKKSYYQENSIIIVSAYALTAEGRYMKSSKKNRMKINTQDYSINGAEHIDMKFD